LDGIRRFNALNANGTDFIVRELSDSILQKGYKIPWRKLDARFFVSSGKQYPFFNNQSWRKRLESDLEIKFPDEKSLIMWWQEQNQ